LNPKRHTLHSHFESVEYNNFGFDDQIQIVHQDEHQDVEVISSDIEPGLLDMLAQAERDHNSLAVSPVQSFDTCYSDPEFDQELGNFDWNDCLENMAYLSSQNMLDVEDLEYFSAYSEVDSDGDADMHSDWGSEIDASLETIGGLLYDHGELELDSYSD
jgi:hypothetical protein